MQSISTMPRKSGLAKQDYFKSTLEGPITPLKSCTLHSKSQEILKSLASLLPYVTRSAKTGHNHIFSEFLFIDYL